MGVWLIKYGCGFVMHACRSTCLCFFVLASDSVHSLFVCDVFLIFKCMTTRISTNTKGMVFFDVVVIRNHSNLRNDIYVYVKYVHKSSILFHQKLA